MMGYLIIMIIPGILMMWAQYKVKANFAKGMQVPARLSGAAAARHILDSAGLTNVAIEQSGQGHLSDHYDPRDKVVRLSQDVYHGQSAASVGIAAHEVGHAIQDATNYGPLVIRNAAVPAAKFGGGFFMILILAGMLLQIPALFALGIVLFCGVVFFQLINLPVEFDASNRAKRVLVEMGMVDEEGASAVNGVLNAAAWTYVAATLQSVLTLAYYILIFSSGRRE